MAHTPVPLRVAPRRQLVESWASALVRGAERLFCTAALLLFAGAIVHLWVQGSGAAIDLADGNPLVRKLFFLTYGVGALFVALRWKQFVQVVGRNKVNLLLALLAIVSLTWSAAPDITLRRGIALLLTTAFGWYLAVRYPAISLLRLIALSIGVALVLSMAAGLFLPHYGISGGWTAGAWRGVFFHKNELGRAAALGGLVFLLLWKADRRHRWLYGAGFLLAATLIFLAQSKTALLVLCTSAALLPVLGTVRWQLGAKVPAMAAALLIGGGAALILGLNAASALEMMGRDTTLTGRTDLWGSLISIGAAQPWLGAGYSAFWMGGTEEVAVAQYEAGWGATGSHNGFIDLWLELGFVGLLLFTYGVIAALRLSLAAFRVDGNWEAAWPILYIVFLLLFNLSESAILKQNNVFWLLYVTSVASASRLVPFHGGAQNVDIDLT